MREAERETPAINELKMLANRFGGRVRDLLERDPNVNGMLIAECKFRHREAAVEWAVSSTSSRITVVGRRAEYTFSFGAPHRALLYDVPVSVPTLRGDVVVFVPGWDPQPARSPKEWFSQPENVFSIERIGLCNGESLHVMRGSISTYVGTRGLEGNIDLLERLIDLMERLAPSVPVDSMAASSPLVDRANLPKSIQHLTPLLELWSVGDDVVRWQKIDDASADELKSLTSQVVPHLREMKDYIASFGTGAQSFEASLLFWLMHLVEDELPPVIRARGQRKGT